MSGEAPTPEATAVAAMAAVAAGAAPGVVADAAAGTGGERSGGPVTGSRGGREDRGRELIRKTPGVIGW